MSFVKIQAIVEKLNGPEGKTCESAFDVINATDAPLRIGIEAIGDAKAWVKLDASQVELTLPPKGQQKVKANVALPAGSAGQRSSFKLRVYRREDPETAVESIAVGVEVDAKPVPVVPDVPKKEEGKTPWGLIIGGIAAAVVLLSVAGVVTYIVTRPKVPDVVELPVDEALTLLSDRGLTPSVTEEFSGNAVAGNVVSQEPAAGEKVPEDKIVTLVVELASVEVPTVIGFNVRAATEKLTAAGLAVGATTSQRTGNSPGGTVIDQEIKPPARALPGQPIALTVEKELVRVPNLQGMNWSVATQALRDSGLQLQSRNQVNTGAAPGTIVTQDPAAAAEVDAGAVVQVDVEIQKVAVPSVLNQSLQDATRAIGRANLVVAPVQPAYVPTPPYDTVAGQTPAAGAQVPPGTPVVLSVRTQLTIREPIKFQTEMLRDRTMIMKTPGGGLRVVPPEEP